MDWGARSHRNERIPKLDLVGSQKKLAGGFNPSEKYQSNWIISPGRDENKKNVKPPPRKHPVRRGDGKIVKVFQPDCSSQPSPDQHWTPFAPREKLREFREAKAWWKIQPCNRKSLGLQHSGFASHKRYSFQPLRSKWPPAPRSSTTPPTESRGDRPMARWLLECSGPNPLPWGSGRAVPSQWTVDSLAERKPSLWKNWQLLGVTVIEIYSSPQLRNSTITWNIWTPNLQSIHWPNPQRRHPCTAPWARFFWTELVQEKKGRQIYKFVTQSSSQVHFPVLVQISSNMCKNQIKPTNGDKTTPNQVGPVGGNSNPRDNRLDFFAAEEPRPTHQSSGLPMSKHFVRV